MHGQPVAAIFTSVAPDGYSGNIKLLVGILHNGVLAGVRVISHKETPGLGDAIEADRSNWILSFNEKSLQNPPLKQWGVKKDGGFFDSFTGATITPRAVVNAVKNTLLYFQENREMIFSATTAATEASNGRK
jgi:electron transport complex protein RnfG